MYQWNLKMILELVLHIMNVDIGAVLTDNQLLCDQYYKI